MRALLLALALLAIAAPARALDRLTRADGVFFVDAAEGAVRFTASGFVCPAAAGSLERADLLVVDPADGGRDLGCRLFKAGDKTWISVFVTRYDDGRSAQTQFDTHISEAVAVAPPAPGSPDLDPPLAAGAPPLPSHGRFWKDAEGRGQGVWLCRVGRWYVEVRATFAEGDETALGEAAGAIFRSAYRTIHDEVAVAAPPPVSNPFREFTGPGRPAQRPSPRPQGDEG